MTRPASFRATKLRNVSAGTSASVRRVLRSALQSAEVDRATGAVVLWLESDGSMSLMTTTGCGTKLLGCLDYMSDHVRRTMRGEA